MEIAAIVVTAVAIFLLLRDQAERAERYMREAQRASLPVRRSQVRVIPAPAVVPEGKPLFLSAEAADVWALQTGRPAEFVFPAGKLEQGGCQ